MHAYNYFLLICSVGANGTTREKKEKNNPLEGMICYATHFFSFVRPGRLVSILLKTKYFVGCSSSSSRRAR